MTAIERPIIRVAICGEVRSGKSSLINGLLRENILPDNLGKDERPFIAVRYDDVPEVQYLGEDQQSVETSTLLNGRSHPNIKSIQVIHNKDDLAVFEFIEVPLTTVEELTDTQVAMIRSSDVLVWVTIASQAWRLTEKQILDELGEARPSHCILAVSRADKLRRKEDQDKISSRINRETEDYFQEQVFVSNSKLHIENSVNSGETWAASGTGKIEAYLTEVAEEIYHEIGAYVEPHVDVAETVEEASTEEHELSEADAYAEIVTPFVEAVEDGVCIGMYSPESSQSWQVLKGDPEVCQNAGEACREIGSKWLSSYGVEVTKNTDFSVAMMTASESVHYRTLPGRNSLFLRSDQSKMSHGTAQTKLSQIYKGILDQASASADV